ncbi:MAG: NUDIX domain-containing protein [Clostridia bacterium]|nr:NUDIX domain-containing protein [Clostridia bacterium]
MTGHAELQCTLHPLDSLKPLRFVVVCSFLEGRFLLSYHRKHRAWETQGGHIEFGETPEEAARRELFEESGATGAKLVPVCDYYGWDSAGSSNGRLYAAIIDEMPQLPHSEMSEVKAFEALPENLTYPLVTPVLFEASKRKLAELE